MIIVNGIRVYKKDIMRLRRVDNDGWDYYDGRNHQWYTLSACQLDGGSILYRLRGSNSGDCYGDYDTIYAIGGDNIRAIVANKRGARNRQEIDTELGKLLGDIDEDNKFLTDIILPDIFHF